MKVSTQSVPVFATPFVMLPFELDIKRLQSEVSNLMEMEWLAHPQKFAGNQALPLVSVNGQYNHDFAISGQMLPTPALHHCPYIRRVLASLQVPISRTRLMLLAPGAEVSRHFDAGYHWYRRVRIHIPVLTHSDVFFGCADQKIHMQEGEVWTFDHRKWHWVKNNSSFPRVHLVIDTKGSPELFSYLSSSEERPDNERFYVRKENSFRLEPYCFEVLEPDEVAYLLLSLIECFDALNESQVVLNLKTLKNKWQDVFTLYGHSVEGEKAYGELIRAITSIVDVEKLNQPALNAYGTIATMLDKNNGAPVAANV